MDTRFIEMSQKLTYVVGLRSDVGRQRSLNEDSAAVLDLPGTQAAFVVCDGMGGLRAGDIASNEAVRVVSETLTERFARGIPGDLETVLRDAFTRANDAVNGIQDGDKPAPAGAGGEEAPTVKREPADALMGTTCVTGVVVGDVLHIAHAGDSRGYLFRDGKLTPLTDDHSYVAERVRAGDITEAEARVSRFRNMITRAIGIDPVVNPDVKPVPLRAGDTILVCSDGLTTELEDPEIEPLLKAPSGQRATAERLSSLLVDAANKKGGRDNITVLAVRVGGDAEATTEMQGQSGLNVVDMDAPSDRGNGTGRRGTAAVFLFGGIVFLLLAAALLFFYPPARRIIPGRSESVTPAGVVSSPLSLDYARLVYDAPKPFAPVVLARGDLLSWSREGGLYFARNSLGTIAALNKKGEPGRSVATIEEIGSKDVPATRMYLASDPQGNVYLSYTKRRVIEKKGTDGRLLQTLQGFDHPEAIAVDDAGNLYVVDYNQIKILTAHPPTAKPAPLPSPQHTPAASPFSAPSGKPGKP